MQPKFSINTSQNVNIELEIAGIGDRLIALLLDYLILGGISKIFVILFSWGLSTSSNGIYIMMAIYGFFAFTFHFFMELLMKGQTIGKRYRKIKVVHKSGRDAGVLELLIRNLIRPIDSFYGIGVMVIFLTKKSQRIGDLAGGTLVIKFRKDQSIAQTAYSEIAENYSPKFPKLEIMKLSEQDIELIKEVTNRDYEEMNWQLVRMTAENICKKTGLNPGELNNLEFLKSLSKEFQYHSLN